MTGLANLTLIQAASGQATSLELLHACWANPDVNAMVWQEREAAETAARAADRALAANTRPSNYLGLPTVSVPCGFDPNGCPIGLQIAGRPFSEGRILQVAGAYQLDTNWHRARPAILGKAA